MALTIAFMNNKGGVGKTTTVWAIGMYWASQYKKKVLLIDLDSQASLTDFATKSDIDKEWERTIHTAFVEGPDKGLPIVNVCENLDIVPADLELAGVNEATANQKMREWMLSDLLATVDDKYDFILLDCPPALGLIAYNALVAAQYLCIVTNANGPSYHGVDMMGRMYKEVKSNPRMNPDLDILGVVITRYEKNKLNDLYLKKLQDDFKIYVVDPPIRKSTKIDQSNSFKKDIYQVDPEGRATNDYKLVATELLKRILIP